MAQAENTQAFMIQLPWTVPEQPNVQAIVLQHPKEQKIYLDLAHSTDWVVAASIFISALISFLGFIATICIVMKSTQQNIESNKILIESQNELKKNELQFLYKSAEIDKFRNLIAEYFALLMKFNTVVSLAIKQMERDQLIQSLVNYFSEVAYYHMQIELFLDCDLNENHKILKNQLKELMDSLWKIRVQIDGDDKEKINDRIVGFSNEFGTVRDSLIKLINQDMKLQKGE